MAKTPGTIRSEVILRMKAAVESGKSASGFLSEMREAGLGFRRTTFLSDLRSVGNVEKKTGLLKYVRKGFQPSPSLYAETEWNLSREFFYKIKVQTRLKPGEPIESRFINIVTDSPMSPGEWEEQVKQLWATKYRGVVEEVVKIEPILAMKRAAI